MVVYWKTRAERTVQQQYCWYVELMGEKAAAKFLSGVMADAVRIGQNPELGRVEELLKGKALGRTWRSFVSGRRYKIVYFVEHDAVHIAYIWCCVMNKSTLGSIIKKSR